MSTSARRADTRRPCLGCPPASSSVTCEAGRAVVGLAMLCESTCGSWSAAGRVGHARCAVLHCTWSAGTCSMPHWQQHLACCWYLPLQATHALPYCHS
jgi:hypothetical protein